MEEVRQFLGQCRLSNRLDILMPHLERLGVTCLEDLLDVEKEDMGGLGLTVIETNRFFRCINERLRVTSPTASSLSSVGSSASSSYLQSAMSGEGTVTSSLTQVPPRSQPAVFTQSPLSPVVSTMQQSPPGVTSSSLQSSSLQQAVSPSKPGPPSSLHSPHEVLPSPPVHIVIRYIVCKDLFSMDAKERFIINTDPNTVTMKDLHTSIATCVDVEEGYVLELFSHEGYPLCPNEFTLNCTLKQWGVTNNDLFYVFVRREDQPDSPSPQGLFPLDHNSGPDELVVESAIFGAITIKANVDADSPDAICQKVCSAAKIPTPNICLYTRRGYERLNVDTELRSGDLLSLVLKNPQDYLGCLGTEYGGKTYNPVIFQTDLGISKFFSILKFICSKERNNVDIPRLLVFLSRLTTCPPMVYALKLLYENSYLKLPCWVALVEGFYQLFRHYLRSFSIVEDKKVFEFSDYFFGMIIEQSEMTPEMSFDDYDKLCLVCPISQLKIVNPVIIPGCTEVFDKRSVLERIESDVSIAGCSKYPLTEEDMATCSLTARMLMYNPWHNEKEVYVIRRKQPPPSPAYVRRVELSCEWPDLQSKLHTLRIASPDGLFSGNECLTFISKGQMVYFLGFSKGKDSGRKVFNPVKCDYEYHEVTEMSTVAKSQDAIQNVCHDLTKFLKPEIKSRASRQMLEKARPAPIVAQKEVETVNWDPEEAIVVLLDASGSMSLNIFDEEENGITRLQAAKDFFEAFANRSQAYDFHHSLGLTVFSSTITVTQKLTRIYEFFRESLDKVEANYQTALNDAMMNAVKQLKDFTKKIPGCKRRILCLTDGCDNTSKKAAHEVVKTLQQENVVVDTVLIIDTPENVTQKAITHASGGACFLPKSLSEALKLFEMETLLSIRARVVPQNLQSVRSARDLRVYENVTSYPYNLGQLPSNFIEGVQSAKTSSADKVLRMASLAISLDEPRSTTSPNACMRRILSEINGFRRNPHADIEIFPSEESVMVWKILLRGPEATPYSGGVFLLCAKFPSTYPGKPPEVRFLTPIYHCNINSSGRICHRIFGPSYTPSVTMRDILSCVCGLLMSPEPDDPLDSVLADEYHSNHSVYFEKARKWTKEHAKKKPFTEMKKELAGGEEAQGPTDLKCPLTGKLFENPVITPSGNTYEKEAILEYIRKHEKKDPITKGPLKEDQLTPNKAMKGLVEQYKKGSSRMAHV